MLCVIGIMFFFVFIGSMARGPKHHDIEAMAKLCRAYFTYVDTTHKSIEAIEKLCWRGGAMIPAE